MKKVHKQRSKTGVPAAGNARRGAIDFPAQLFAATEHSAKELEINRSGTGGGLPRERRFRSLSRRGDDGRRG